MGQSSSKIEDGKVYFYPDPNFQGNPLVVDRSMTIPEVNGNSGIGANQLSSLSIPSGFEVFLFRQPRFMGEYRHFRGPTRIPKLEDSHFDDATSSVIVARSVVGASEIGTDEVALYFAGRGGVEGLVLKAPFDINNITRLGIPNNALQEVKVGDGLTLSLYDKHNFNGDNELIRGPYSGDLKSLNGRASSIRATLNEKKLQEVSTNFNLSSSVITWLVILLILILLIWVFFSFRRK
jgi:hypothetical protein